MLDVHIANMNFFILTKNDR